MWPAKTFNKRATTHTTAQLRRQPTAFARTTIFSTMKVPNPFRREFLPKPLHEQLKIPFVKGFIFWQMLIGISQSYKAVLLI